MLVEADSFSACSSGVKGKVSCPVARPNTSQQVLTCWDSDHNAMRLQALFASVPKHHRQGRAASIVPFQTCVCRTRALEIDTDET